MQVLKMPVAGSKKPKNPPGQKQPAALTPVITKTEQSIPAGQPADAEPAKAEPEEKYLILPKIDNSRIFYVESPNLKKPTVNNPAKIKSQTIEVQKILFIKRRDSLIMMIAGNQVRRFSDSLIKQTKDTLYFLTADTLQIKPYIEVYKEPKEVYKISSFVFISKDGNVTIALSDCNHKNYAVEFFETDSTRVMEVKNIKDPVLIIDKANFIHAGWFRFELYQDGKLKEKNKLLIPKEF